MRKPVRIGLIVAAGVAAVAGVLLLIAWRAYRHVPEFYDEAIAIDPGEQRQASREMSSRVTMLYSDAQRRGDWQALFTTEQINGWLAVDLKEKHADLLPDTIRDPRVAIGAGLVTLALRVQSESIDAVFSLGFEPYLVEPNVVAFRLRKARAGAIPIPLADVLAQIEDAARKANLAVRWTEIENDPVAILTLAPHRDRHGHITLLDKLDVQEGQVYLSGRTQIEAELLKSGGEHDFPTRVADEPHQMSHRQR